jgi:hypothetical protein
MVTKRNFIGVIGSGDALMSTVIAFPRTEPREKLPTPIDGATLFMHIRKTTLIVHLGGAQTQPQSAGTKSG